jgi:hypothetical protein
MEKSAVARLTEVTNGRFVEAKHEEPALSIGQLWRSPTGGYESFAGAHERQLTGIRFSWLFRYETAPR